jgi:hypothetical protein
VVFTDVVGADILRVIEPGRAGIGDELDLVRHFFGDVVLEFNQLLDLPERRTRVFLSSSMCEKYSDTDLHGSTQIRLLDRFRSSKNYQPFVQEWQSSENRRQITTRD